MSEQAADAEADGRAWALRQQDAFPEWVTRYGGGDPGRWDFGLDSLNVLTYIVFDHFPTVEAIDQPDNAAFSEPAAWYLGEIIRRSDPKKLRWSRCDYGLYAGHYVVEPTARTRKGYAEDPLSHLRAVPYFGDPMFLRSRYLDYVAPLWDKPWPPWVHSSETGRWSWDEAGQRWFSQLDQWLNGIAGLLQMLAAQLPDTVLDYSTASLEAVEIFTVNTPAVMTPHSLMRGGVMAYVGECLLRTGGEKWIWDENPDHLTNGFPVVERNVTRVSPAHLIEFACVRQDGQTFARIHRAWIAEQEEHRRRAPESVRQRELTPGLDVMPEPRPIQTWVVHAATQFPHWAARYGAGRRWDFSAGSMDDLAHVILEHCPAGTSLVDAPDGDAFIGGVVWYFGETLHRAKPSHWGYSGKWALTTGRGWDGPQIITNDMVFRAYELSVFLMQELDSVTRPRRLWGPSEPETNPKRLRNTYERWVTAAIRERIEGSQKRREQAKRRAGSKRSDEETLARWLAAREAEFTHWIERFGPGAQWDFSVESLDRLEALIRQIAPGPEDLLEDKANADFLEGAAWYFGEALRRADPGGIRWGYERRYHPEPHLVGSHANFPAERLATVYTADGGVLCHDYDIGRMRKERRGR